MDPLAKNVGIELAASLTFPPCETNSYKQLLSNYDFCILWETADASTLTLKYLSQRLTHTHKKN